LTLIKISTQFQCKGKNCKSPRNFGGRGQGSTLNVATKGIPNEAIGLVIERAHDPIEYITKFKISFNRTRIIVNNSVKQLGNFVTLFCDSKNIILPRKEDNVEVKNIL
jgi:hypothetical protein